MADEFRTLLKIDGDASGAKQAAEQAQKALLDLVSQIGVEGQKVKQLAGFYEAFGETREQALRSAQSQVTGDILGGTSDQVSKTKIATKEVSENFRDMGRNAGAFGEILSRFDPVMGALVTSATKLKEVFGFIFSPLGILVAAAIAGFLALRDAIDKAAQAAQRFADQMVRVIKSVRQVQADVASELAALGKGTDAAFDKATGVTQTLKGQGFSAGAAAATAAGIVNPDGTLAVPEDDVILYAAGVQRGDISFAGDTPRQRGIALDKAQRYVGRNRGDLYQAARALTLPTQRQREDIKNDPSSPGLGSVESQVEFLISQGWDAADARRAVNDAAEIRRRGVGGGTSQGGIRAAGFKDEAFLQYLKIELLTGLNKLGLVGSTEREERIKLAEQARKQLDASPPPADLPEIIPLNRPPRTGQPTPPPTNDPAATQPSGGQVTNYIMHNRGTIVYPGTTGFEKVSRAAGMA